MSTGDANPSGASGADDADLAVRVADDESTATLTEYVFGASVSRTSRAQVLDVLTQRFALSFDDARLALARVVAGRLRAIQREGAPDRERDPLAFAAYERQSAAASAPVPRVWRESTAWRALVREVGQGDVTAARATVDRATFRAAAKPDERAAAALWALAFDGTATAQGTQDPHVARLTVDLGAATMESRSEPEIKRRVLVESATALARAADAQIAALGDAPFAPAGSAAWLFAVWASNASRHLAACFATLGHADHELSAVGLTGRIVTSLMAQCPARVGLAMVDYARCAARHGDADAASQSCRAVVTDFETIVAAWEHRTSAPFDEHRLAVGAVVSAVDLLDALEASDDAAVALRQRARTLLARTERDAQADAHAFTLDRADRSLDARSRRQNELVMLVTLVVICIAIGGLARAFALSVLTLAPCTATWVGVGVGVSGTLVVLGAATRAWLARRRKGGSPVSAPSISGAPPA